jgi:hypothetical protein
MLNYINLSISLLDNFKLFSLVIYYDPWIELLYEWSNYFYKILISSFY